MTHTAITLTCTDEIKDILIAELSEKGFDGFEEQGATLVAYIPEKNFNEGAVNALTSQYGVNYTRDTVEQQNWNAVWESNFQPVLVDNFCGIRASFHESFNPAPLHEIVITPKMSFGTGHHATTASMIKLMQGIEFRGRKVFDFGTGTGILAILAAKMGAAVIDAIDIDTWSVENTKENIENNGALAVKVWQSDTLKNIRNTYHIVLANINRNILLEFMADMRRLLERDGILLLSGILKEDEPAILEAARQNGLVLDTLLDKDNWLAMKLLARK
ncbi:50S ribosomal protein L11 methyltransferase [Chitinophaga sancti]|uniref:Ribosomal protein L11 methyltransferase n=1 Tax=Chitinophaga sancti TaxID=1004 RepID=A0A1K1QL72_9BACT|nr:50S ribosomal protein L11 methyltransferase [Chitinophaga sancti]WQD65162.1 50S ribosomal protein L11 methyltransferase [Chitinophaga sancti]WQG89214.1 50S ribosomal protein L11 methyltransferase [Chitinophaga sancti]SFW60401.1 ribosomal protein L11 methyltransferase [Chitinophaga sancti]